MTPVNHTVSKKLSNSPFNANQISKEAVQIHTEG